MINSTNFYQLSYQQQADLLLANATFLLSRIEDSFIVDLYELDDLLVEVFYQAENEDLVSVMAYNTSEKLRTLTNGANLKPRLTIKKDMPYQTLNEYFA
ncbi:MAG TPA: hypothetical protein VFT06_16245 [Flavisolibacter sp.]|jgi:hypothetical protein|nr:hypothetical protein [Flavisolibacter sp.]